jgi:hypothetical protein
LAEASNLSGAENDDDVVDAMGILAKPVKSTMQG